MVQYLEKYKKNIVIDMRKRGFSYSEIQIKMNIPKSTIAYWLKGIKLTPEQRQKLENRRSETAKANIEKRVTRTARLISEINSLAAKNIPQIAKRELWLMGVVLYWKSQNKMDHKNGVRFASSEPSLIKLFLKWLEDIGEIKQEEVVFDIFSEYDKPDKLEEIKKYWSKTTSYPKAMFSRVYFQKRKKPLIRKNYERAKNGILRIRVRASSMLARQISGWIKGVERQI